MVWRTSSKKKKNSGPEEFHLQRLPVTMAELAEDAGHMGYTSTFYPGSPAWEAEMAHRRERRKDNPLQMRMPL